MRSINKKQSLADLRKKIKFTSLSRDKSIQHYLWSRHRLNISSISSCNDRYEGVGRSRESYANLKLSRLRIAFLNYISHEK